jgi:hypothetical protein
MYPLILAVCNPNIACPRSVAGPTARTRDEVLVPTDSESDGPLSQSAFESTRNCAKCHDLLLGQMSFVLLDGVPYCQQCVTNAGFPISSLRDGAIEEVVLIPFSRSLLLGLYSGLVASVVALLVIGTFVLLLVAGQVACGNAAVIAKLVNPGGQFISVVRFIAISLLMNMIVLCPMCIGSTIARRQRCIRIQDGVLTSTDGRTNVSAFATDCSWSIVRFSLDRYTVFSLCRPAIQIVTRNYEFILCGFNDETRQMWSGIFKLLGHAECRGVDWRAWWCKGIIAILLGAIVGMVAGTCIRLWTGNAQWQAVGMVLGVCDGVLWAATGLRAAHQADSIEGSAHIAWQLYIIIIMTCALFGYKIGRLAGWNEAIACLLINGGIGWLMSRMCRRAE